MASGSSSDEGKGGATPAGGPSTWLGSLARALGSASSASEPHDPNASKTTRKLERLKKVTGT